MQIILFGILIGIGIMLAPLALVLAIRLAGVALLVGGIALGAFVVATIAVAIPAWAWGVLAVGAAVAAGAAVVKAYRTNPTFMHKLWTAAGAIGRAAWFFFSRIVMAAVVALGGWWEALKAASGSAVLGPVVALLPIGLVAVAIAWLVRRGRTAAPGRGLRFPYHN